MLRNSFLLISMVFLVAGCASRSLSEHQCIAGDWYTVGERDGLAGASQTRVLDHQNACGRYDVVPDTASYRQGWEAGIERYCTADNGYQQGVSGRGYAGSCPPALDLAFRTAWEDGRSLYLARSAVRKLERQLQQTEERLESIDTELLGTAVAQAQPDLSEEERLALLDKTRQLLEERDRLERALPQLAADLDAAYADLELLEPSIADRR